MKRLALTLLLVGMANPSWASKIPEIEVDVEGGARTTSAPPSSGWSISEMPLDDLIAAMLSETGLIGAPPGDRHRVSVEVPSGEPVDVIMAAASRAGYETSFESGKVSFKHIDLATVGKQSFVYTFRYAHPNKSEPEMERWLYQVLGLSLTSGDVCRYDSRTRQVAILVDRARIPAIQKTLQELDARGAAVELRVARVEVDRQKLADGTAFPNNLVGQVVAFFSGQTPEGDLRMSLPEAESALDALQRQGVVRTKVATVVLDDGSTWRTRVGEGKTTLDVAPTVIGRNAVKLDVSSKADASDEAYSFVAQAGDALLFDPDQPILEMRRTASGGLLLAPASVLGPRSAAEDQAPHSSDIPFSMQSVARSIGRSGLPRTPARGLMPEAGNGFAVRKTSLTTGGGQPKTAAKKLAVGDPKKIDPKKKHLSKKEIEELKKQQAKKKHDFWW
ncbi:hypothetical protein [Verrucomicrobium sp. 3C]|uniref:hypothetical protein n=1 Tax=Verrucomicrobium sp. 3C TaxID=1134055 RepID=UPI0003763405|nr:hypothetical protein [Verrucomicrobium sp. 3C]